MKGKPLSREALLHPSWPALGREGRLPMLQLGAELSRFPARPGDAEPWASPLASSGVGPQG